MDRLAEGRRVFNAEIEALQKTRDCLNETYLKILDLITNCSGKVIVTGIGKSGHIAAKLAATFSSLGTPSFRLHPAEAMHGDLGMVSVNDVVIAISFSGESDEIVRILPNIKMIGAKLVGITGNPNSMLANASDIVQIFPKFEEACYLGLAPTSSTTAALCYGDSLAVVASGIYGFKDTDFGKFHPAGSLGKRLILKVEDLMSKEEKNPQTYAEAPLKDVVVELSRKGMGAVSVIDENNKVMGIITDGDLRRQLEKGVDIYHLYAKEVMSVNPSIITPGSLAIDALKIMKEKNISCLIVAEENKSKGIIRLQDIVGVGIVG